MDFYYALGHNTTLDVWNPYKTLQKVSFPQGHNMNDTMDPNGTRWETMGNNKFIVYFQS